MLLLLSGRAVAQTWVRNDTLAGTVQYVDRQGKWMVSRCVLYDSIFLEDGKYVGHDEARRITIGGGKVIDCTLFYIFVPIGYWQKF